jgi:MacB-like periplasmic core domain
VVLTHVLWDSRFGSDPAILGRKILLDGEPHTVIAVLPKGGPFDRAVAQIWKPLAFQPSNMTRDFRWLGASAKLRPGVTLEAARAEMNVNGLRLADAYPDSNKGWGVAVDRLGDVLVGPQLHSAVTVLFAATLFVLLIGGANLANLALARNMNQQHEGQRDFCHDEHANQRSVTRRVACMDADVRGSCAPAAGSRTGSERAIRSALITWARRAHLGGEYAGEARHFI